jgi:hypothetical protein
MGAVPAAVMAAVQLGHYNFVINEPALKSLGFQHFWHVVEVFGRTLARIT